MKLGVLYRERLETCDTGGVGRGTKKQNELNTSCVIVTPKSAKTDGMIWEGLERTSIIVILKPNLLSPPAPQKPLVIKHQPRRILSIS